MGAISSRAICKINIKLITMQCTFIVNGKLQLVITPSNNLEKEMLQELFKQETTGTMQEKLQIGDKALVDSVVITHTVKQTAS